MTNIRNNDRVNLDDPELAALMWSRISHVLPLIDDQHAVGVDSQSSFLPIRTRSGIQTAQRWFRD